MVKLFAEIGKQHGDRNGGYTQIVRVGQRLGDAAPLAILEWTGTVTAAPAPVTEKKAEEPKSKEPKSKEPKAPKATKKAEEKKEQAAACDVGRGDRRQPRFGIGVDSRGFSGGVAECVQPPIEKLVGGHRRRRMPLAVWQDGKVVHIQPDQACPDCEIGVSVARETRARPAERIVFV